MPPRENYPRPVATPLPTPRTGDAIHGDHAGYEVEFMTLTGHTLAVVSLVPDQVRPIGRRKVAHVRELAMA